MAYERDAVVWLEEIEVRNIAFNKCGNQLGFAAIDEAVVGLLQVAIALRTE